METSVFTAEAWALLQAIGVIEDLGWYKAVVFMDSLSVVDAVASLTLNLDNYLIQRIRCKLRYLTNLGFQIILCWVPSHRGIPGNELADMAAKDAISTGVRPLFSIPHSDFYTCANDLQSSIFRAFLEESAYTKGKQHFNLYQKDFTKHPWFNRKLLKREEIVIINRIRSNHYNLNYSLHRKNMSDSPACTCGDSRQDANHILFYCPLTIHKSENLRNFIKSEYPTHEIDIFPILTDPGPKLCRLILAYFKSCCLSI